MMMSKLEGREEVDRVVCFRKALCAATVVALLGASAAVSGCGQRDRAQSPAAPAAAADQGLVEFVSRIKAVDNHTHVNSVDPSDADSDALPIDGLPPFSLPVRLRLDDPVWVRAFRALYAYPHQDVSEAHLGDLRSAAQRARRDEAETFPVSVLDKIGTEVMLANRIAMGPGLVPPRFLWVSYVDALMLPLSTKDEAAGKPDRKILFPLEDKLLRRYMDNLNVQKLPVTLDEYLQTIVTPTLERQRQGGAVAIKFEAAYLRALDFADVPAETARRVYARYARGGEPSHGDYRALQDFLFRYLAREAGRLGLAVHIHSFEGAGGFFGAAGSDPLLLEPTFNDPALRSTSFVIVHGGGMYAQHAGAMLWKPNVYVDASGIALIYPPAKLATVLADWLRQYPEKVLFGTDAAGFGPDQTWEVTAWVGTTTVRQALALALTDLMNAGEIDRARAEQIATMVMRTNAAKLYKLALN